MGCIRIEREANGYTVSVTDPKIVAYNNKRDNSKGPYLPYKDPQKCYVFKTCKEVTEFVTKNIDKALPVDDYSGAFDTAAAVLGDDD